VQVLQPRVMALVVPPATRVPSGYCIVLEDRMMCRGEVSNVPGAVSVVGVHSNNDALLRQHTRAE
jgi:hypothetical protein